MILITGAGGLIGRHLLSQLKPVVKKQVIPVYHAKNFRFCDDKIFMDLTIDKHLEHLKKLEIKPDIVIHLAGQLAKSGMPISTLYRSNILATTSLLEYCINIGVKHFIFASSYKIYGFPLVGTVTEETPANPSDHYAMSKLCCENILNFSHTDDMSITVFRYPSIYSENNHAGAVYNFFHEAITSCRITIKADVPVPYDTINLNDVINSLIRAVEVKPRGYSAYNISTGEPSSLDILADRIADLVPDCTVIRSKIQQPVFKYDPTKAHQTFGWTAESSHFRFKDMLEIMRHDQ